MIDKALIVRKINLISTDLKEIIRLSEMSREAYLSDLHSQVLAERYLERVIGRMIDINYHLITESGQPPPKDYYESFLKLGALDVIHADLSREMASSAGLRNRIAHEYDEIDHDRVHEGLATAARNIPVYLKHVDAFLNSLPE
jgi:uncharacterized protein YutE (UPF0331/DUF86 family)